MQLTEEEQIELARQANLRWIHEQLGNPQAENRLGAVMMLVHLASTYGELPAPVRDLLIRAASDADPEIEQQGRIALFNIDHPERPEEGVPESVLIARSQRARLKTARMRLAGTNSGQRVTALHQLLHLLSAAPSMSEEIIDILRELASDTDPSIARPAMEVVTRHDEAARNPGLVRPARRSKRGEEFYQLNLALLADPEALTRLGAIENVLEVALADRAHVDPEVIKALETLLDDPDLMVAHRAKLALIELTGREEEFRG